MRLLRLLKRKKSKLATKKGGLPHFEPSIPMPKVRPPIKGETMIKIQDCFIAINKITHISTRNITSPLPTAQGTVRTEQFPTAQGTVRTEQWVLDITFANGYQCFYFKTEVEIEDVIKEITTCHKRFLTCQGRLLRSWGNEV
ncbi:MAG: hypothetical protein ACTSO3_15980 [Candidatus Heimdallarchaeaceae archaeon]